MYCQGETAFFTFSCGMLLLLFSQGSVQLALPSDRVGTAGRVPAGMCCSVAVESTEGVRCCFKCLLCFCKSQISDLLLVHLVWISQKVEHFLPTLLLSQSIVFFFVFDAFVELNSYLSFCLISVMTVILLSFFLPSWVCTFTCSPIRYFMEEEEHDTLQCRESVCFRALSTLLSLY